jgi:hypothetical protein
MTNPFKPGDEVVRVDFAPIIEGVTGEVRTVKSIPEPGFIELEGSHLWFSDRNFRLAAAAANDNWIKNSEDEFDLAASLFELRTGTAASYFTTDLSTEEMRPYFAAARALLGKNQKTPAEMAAESAKGVDVLDVTRVHVGDWIEIKNTQGSRLGGEVTMIHVPLSDTGARNITLDLFSLFEGETTGSPLYVTVGRGYWDLVDHQPAVEPEGPAPGFYIVSPDANPEARYTGFIDNNGDFHGTEDGFLRNLGPGDYTIVRRLVVIDPAEVDRGGVARALRGEGEPGTYDYIAADAVIKYLGLTR